MRTTKLFIGDEHGLRDAEGYSRLDPQDLSDFSRDLRRKRKSLGVTGTELAEASGISIAYVSMLEAGRRSPSEEVKRRVLDALDRLGKESETSNG